MYREDISAEVREESKMNPNTLPIFLSLIFFLFVVVVDVESADILPGETLSASSRNVWNSQNNTFSLGFISKASAFFVAITYNGIPVWKAGGDRGAADSTASFQFLPSGDLRLVNGSSGSVVWQSNTAGRGVSSASLDDSGNFVLRSNRSVPIWSTFENPTDTILPGQHFTTKNVLRSGDYYFRLKNSGSLTLKWNDSIVYSSGLNSGLGTEWYSSGLNSSVTNNLTSPSLGFQSIGILSLSDPSLANSAILVYSNDYVEGTDILRFLRLDDDGNLRIYSSARGSGAVTVRWSAVSDQCQVFGYCGNLGICSYNDSGPICKCPSRNFVPIDPNDSRKGCKRKVEIESCPGTATMLTLNNTRFLTYDPELSSQVFFIVLSACRLNCLVDDSCIASTALSDGTGLCYLKLSKFVSGYQSPSVPSISYVKVCGPEDPNPSASSLGAGKGTRWKLRAWIVVVVIILTILGLVVVEGGLWWWCFRNSPKFGSLAAQYALLEYASGAPVQFSYKELQRATKNFRDKLGAGGFGAVYKGILSNRTVVAVKQLEGIEQGEKQFRMEVATISSTHHLNLVRLIGFCSEERHRLLVYEFMKNESLDSFLFATEEESGKWLNWESRFKVALGTAKGIAYLHEECRDCIVHCDIKPENILLDDNHNAKVSDFGLAKRVNPKDHRKSLTGVRGTRGYLAPEWLANLPTTSKSDVYSYGMVLLETVSGRRNFNVSAETNRKRFSIWAYEAFEKENTLGILDKRLVEQRDFDMEQVNRAILVSFWCIQEQPSQRPLMSKVVQMLEGVTEIGKPPAPKAVTDGSGGGTSVSNVSSTNASAFSTIATSAPTPSSSSSLGIQSSASGRNVEKASSSFLRRAPLSEDHPTV